MTRSNKFLGFSIFAWLNAFVFACSANAAEVVVDNRLTELEVVGETDLAGAGGVVLSTLSIPADGRLVLDPIATPVKVEATPTFAAGAKIALSSDYAGVTLGRVVLMTYSGTATFEQSLFDATSVGSGATCKLTEETAPDRKDRQLVLTVGDYEREAKELRILPVGDSITHGYWKKVPSTKQFQQAQYRTAIAARLAANGYKPVMLGHLKSNTRGTDTLDAAGVRQPAEWIWHSGVSGDRIVTSTDSGISGGARDNLHLYLDIAGKPDVITLLIGTNDLGSGMSAEETFVAYTNLVWEIARQRPDAKIVASTILARTQNSAGARGKVAPFNELLLANLANLPASYACTNLCAVVPQSIPDAYFDGLHPTMKGFEPISKGFAAKIMETLPLASYAGPIDDTLTDEPQTAKGAAATVPAAYRDGMKHVFTLDAANAKNGFCGAAPYTATNATLALATQIKKAGYYLELVRKGTNRRRYVWVDFDATGKTLDDIDFPQGGETFHAVVDNLHVFSNDSSVHNIAPDAKGHRGIVEATSANYEKADGQLEGVPADAMGGNTFGWNDSVTSNVPGYGCFQAHRIFSQQGDDRHWNDGEVLLAWNRWGLAKDLDEIGIGTFANHASGFNTLDYTFTTASNIGLDATVSADAYQVRHLEIWAEPAE